MSKGLTPLEVSKELKDFVLEFVKNGLDRRFIHGSFDLIEKDLKDYQEIKEIAKRYNWDTITSEIFNVKTDKKYRDLFDSAIVNIQEDYRKARAFDIIKNKRVNIEYLRSCKSLEDYNNILIERWQLTEEEHDLLKEVLL